MADYLQALKGKTPDPRLVAELQKQAGTSMHDPVAAALAQFGPGAAGRTIPWWLRLLDMLDTTVTKDPRVQQNQVLLRRSPQKTPRQVRQFLAETPEGQWRERIKKEWEKLGEGIHREGYRKGGVVAKIPIDEPTAWDSSAARLEKSEAANVLEFLSLLGLDTGGSFKSILTPKPYAFSTKEKIPLVQYLPTAKNPTKQAKLSSEVEEFSNLLGVPDLGEIFIGRSDTKVPHNWSPLEKANKAAVYDFGFGMRNVPVSIPKEFEELFKTNSNLQHYLNPAVRERFGLPEPIQGSSVDTLLRVFRGQ